MPDLNILGVCLALATSLPPPAAPPASLATSPPGTVFVPVQAFTLAWTHSIEKTGWQEDYRVSQDASGQPMLHLESARIRGSGAGMEPPADAVLRNGWYHYRPLAPNLLAPLRLTRSVHTPDYDWCTGQTCRPLHALLPSDGDLSLLWPCFGPP